MEEDGVARIISEEGLCTRVLFTRHQQIEEFHRSSRVVCVDAAHGTNRLNFKLHQFLITDGMGYGRLIFYAFLRRKGYASLITLFEAFLDNMHHDVLVSTIMMDKMAAQIRAARAVFNVTFCCAIATSVRPSGSIQTLAGLVVCFIAWQPRTRRLHIISFY
ncbi:unnamed protein product [Dicrocoelium dendriticum]|nr:unnamed protein product [Dicrocoelium dendriticum]